MTRAQDPHDPTAFAALDVDQHLADPERKRAYVRPMFDLVAPRYDDFTRAFSFGMDRRWKAALVATAAAVIPGRGAVADLAAGTGDLAFALARVRPDLAITAIDLSTRMLAVARARADRPAVRLVAGDLDALPLPDESLDAVTAGYAFRNASDWRGAVGEAVRVLRPGGHLLGLDFHRPEARTWRAAFLWWLWTAGRFVGRRWHGEPMAYGYIARSIEHFVSWQAFARTLDATGFRVLSVRRYLGGGIAIHHAVKR